MGEVEFAKAYGLTPGELGLLGEINRHFWPVFVRTVKRWKWPAAKWGSSDYHRARY
jgi:hypothetical protein